MAREYFRPIQEDTILNVLHYLRAEIAREGLEGAEHVDALLRLRGHDPADRPIPAKVPKAFRRGELTRVILGALRDGPRTGRELAQAVEAASGGMGYRAAYKRTYVALHRLREAGAVRRAEGRWELCHQELAS